MSDKGDHVLRYLNETEDRSEFTKGVLDGSLNFLTFPSRYLSEPYDRSRSSNTGIGELIRQGRAYQEEDPDPEPSLDNHTEALINGASKATLFTNDKKGISYHGGKLAGEGLGVLGTTFSFAAPWAATIIYELQSDEYTEIDLLQDMSEES